MKKNPKPYVKVTDPLAGIPRWELIAGNRLHAKLTPSVFGKGKLPDRLTDARWNGASFGHALQFVAMIHTGRLSPSQREIAATVYPILTDREFDLAVESHRRAYVKAKIERVIGERGLWNLSLAELQGFFAGASEALNREPDWPDTAALLDYVVVKHPDQVRLLLKTPITDAKLAEALLAAFPKAYRQEYEAKFAADPDARHRFNGYIRQWRKRVNLPATRSRGRPRKYSG